MLQSISAPHLFRTLAEEAPHGIIVINAAGLIVWANRQATLTFGYPKGELMELPLETLIPAHFDKHRQHVQRFFHNPETRLMGTGRDLFGRRKDGTEFALEVGIGGVNTATGPLAFATIIDISQRKEQEASLKRSNTDLEQFAVVASHDLQEPIRMVASYMELLSQHYGSMLDERATKYLYYAMDGAQRMRSMVAGLLAYARIDTQGRPLQPTSSTEVLQDVLHDLQMLIKENQAEIHANNLPEVLADRRQLAQLFQNLIANAIKFRSDAPPKIHIKAALNHDTHPAYWHFSVADNGTGFDMAHAAKIFDIFRRLHARTISGHGIGLAVTQRIIERHGGRLWCEAAPNQGATFHFTLKPVGAPTP